MPTSRRPPREPDPKRIVVDPDEIIQPSDLGDHTPLRNHVLAMVTFSALLLAGLLAFAAVILFINATVGH